MTRIKGRSMIDKLLYSWHYVNSQAIIACAQIYHKTCFNFSCVLTPHVICWPPLRCSSEGVKPDSGLSMTRRNYAEDTIPVFSRSRAASLDREYYLDSPLATWLNLGILYQARLSYVCTNVQYTHSLQHAHSKYLGLVHTSADKAHFMIITWSHNWLLWQFLDNINYVSQSFKLLWRSI